MSLENIRKRLPVHVEKRKSNLRRDDKDKERLPTIEQLSEFNSDPKNEHLLRLEIEGQFRYLKKFSSDDQISQEQEILRTGKPLTKPLATRVVINGKSPEQVSRFLLHLDEENSRQMDPENHRKSRVIEIDPDIIGSRYHRDEQIGRLNIKGEWLITETQETIKKDEYIIVQKKMGMFPVELHHTLKKVEKGTELTHELYIGFTFLGIEKICDWFIEKFMLPSSQKAMRDKFKTLEPHIQ
jgi:hypothetical protein